MEEILINPDYEDRYETIPDTELEYFEDDPTWQEKILQLLEELMIALLIIAVVGGAVFYSGYCAASSKYNLSTVFK